MWSRSGEFVERDVDAADDDAVALVDRRRDAEADRRDRRRRAARRPPPRARARTCSCDSSGRRALVPADDLARRASTTPARIFVPPRSTPIAWLPSKLSGYRNPPDGRLGEKPYRVYRGGRVKGKVPLPRRERDRGALAGSDGSRGPAGEDRASGRPRRRRRLWSAGRGGAGRCVTLVVLVVLARRLGRRSATSPSRSGVNAANKRLPPSARRRARAAEAGCCSRHRDDDPAARHRPRDGTGRRAAAPTSTPTRSCSCAPTRAATASSTSRSRATCSSPCPGYGDAKINAAFQIGGATLAIQTIHELLGRSCRSTTSCRRLRRLRGPDRRRRRDHVNVPETILSNRFDCPYATQHALRAVAGLALPEGRAAHERPARADLLAHPREPARPGETDFDAPARQQAVMQATLAKLASPSHVLLACRSTAARC